MNNIFQNTTLKVTLFTLLMIFHYAAIMYKIDFPSKVIVHKLSGETSLVEQDTIDYVSTAYFELQITKKLKKFENL